MKQLLIIALGCLVLLTTCKKYPEGGYVSRGDNLIAGMWTLKLYEVNGIDSTDLINYNNDDKYKECTFNRYTKNLWFQGKMGGVIITTYMSDSHKTLEAQASDYYGGYYSSKICKSSYCFRPYLQPEKVEYFRWQIQKLTKKELILTASYTNSYKIILTK